MDVNTFARELQGVVEQCRVSERNWHAQKDILLKEYVAGNAQVPENSPYPATIAQAMDFIDNLSNLLRYKDVLIRSYEECLSKYTADAKREPRDDGAASPFSTGDA